MPGYDDALHARPIVRRPDSDTRGVWAQQALLIEDVTLIDGGASSSWLALVRLEPGQFQEAGSAVAPCGVGRVLPCPDLCQAERRGGPRISRGPPADRVPLPL